MGLEVALLEWGEGQGGVRLLGRSGDPELVDLVRQHLAERLAPAASRAPTNRPPSLRPVRSRRGSPKDSNPGDEERE